MPRSGPPPWREEMIADLRGRGVEDQRVLAAMSQVPREQFVPPGLAYAAYEPRPAPIGSDQTISAPAMVATMIAALGLSGSERVLEVGTGSGYAAAVLSRCASEVITIEYHRALARSATRALADLGYHNVEVRHGDGRRGAPDRAPFDAISVTAMADHEVPPALLEQLAPDGVLICPVGDDRHGELIRWSAGRTATLGPVTFVPLLDGT